MRERKRESKVIKKLLERENQETGDVRNGNKELGSKYEKLR
jgi:hypothetical protein